MVATTTKHPAAVALGRLGRAAMTPAQAAASRANGAKGGAPRQRARCPRCEAAKRTCYHEQPKPPLAWCQTCGAAVMKMADGRLIRHFDMRALPAWCAGSNQP